MLVLTRKVGQTIKIGDDIEVQILPTEGASVRLGIVAPRRVAVVRFELLDRPENQNGDVRAGAAPTSIPRPRLPLSTHSRPPAHPAA